MSFRQRLLDCITDKTIEFGIAFHHIESGEDTFINADAPFPTASVFKIPVMVEVFKQAQEGKFSLDDRLPLQERDKTLTSGILLNLQEGLLLTVRDLVMLMTIVSDNVATTMLLRLVGPENVTATMHSLGLNATFVNLTVHEMFLHAFGIPERTDITLAELTQVAKTVQMDYKSRTFSRGCDNDVSTAGDMVRLLTLIYKGEVVDRVACDEMLEILSHQQYNSRVPRYLPWYSTYHKTGSMRGLRNDSGIIYCSETSHVAFSIFSFDGITLPLGDPRLAVQRELLVEEIMGEMGLAAWDCYGGKR